MEKEIKFIIDDYVANVENACCKLLEGINDKENINLRTKWDFFEYRSKNRKMEFDINGVVYKLHGKGCFVFSNEMFLNWDFGYRSRWCGIDPFMIGMTLKENKSECVNYYDGRIIKEACELAVKDGEMFEKNGVYQYSVPLEETFAPNFPQIYDALKVQYFDSEWIIPRNKNIDRFLRKSNRISKGIYDSKDKYILSFMLDKNTIFSIPYNDIDYPESAVKIMSDEIIRNLKK
jgi:hypothetical protein